MFQSSLPQQGGLSISINSMALPALVWVAHETQPLGTSEGALAPTPPGSVPAASLSRRRAQTWSDLFVGPCALPGLRRRKPSGILSATVLRPWRVGQFQRSFLACPRWGPDPPAMVAGLPRSAPRDGRETRLEGRRAEGRCPGGRRRDRRRAGCRRAGLALRRSLRGAATNRTTRHRAPTPTHQGKARRRPSFVSRGDWSDPLRPHDFRKSQFNVDARRAKLTCQ